MDKSVEQFYLKNSDQNYGKNYDKDHGTRLDYVVKEFGLDQLKDKKILDIGCGCGNYFKRLDKSNLFVGLDGAIIPDNLKLCEFKSYTVDLNNPYAEKVEEKDFDVIIISEVLEHLPNPYTCLDEAKKLGEIGAEFIITIPAKEMWHNYIYPFLMIEPTYFEQFLRQMALKTKDFKYWGSGWQSNCWKCENRPYREKDMLYPKSELKFLDATPLEMVNL